MLRQVFFKGMHQHKILLNNEGGFVLVVAMVMMVLLTALGIFATNNSVMEIQIAGNERVYKRNFYKAESATFEAAQLLENEQETEELRPTLTSKTWLKSDNVDYTVPTNWVSTNNLVSGIDDATGDLRLAAVGLGVVKGNKGASLSMSGTTVYDFRLYGRSQEANGMSMIEIGYKKRF